MTAIEKYQEIKKITFDLRKKDSYKRYSDASEIYFQANEYYNRCFKDAILSQSDFNYYISYLYIKLINIYKDEK